MKVIQLKDTLTDVDADALAGKFISLDGPAEAIGDGITSTDWAGVAYTIRKSAVTVLKPDGSPLLIYQPNVIPRAHCAIAFDVFKKVKTVSYNRGLAAGTVDQHEVPDGVAKGSRYQPTLQDGTLSQTSYAAGVNSAIAGYTDRTPRVPFCRLTAFNLDQTAEFVRAKPFVAFVSDLFRQTLPDRWQAQRDIIEKTSPDFYISDSVFTTITVNHNWRTAVHKDRGDFKAGFGVMAALEGGKYTGCELIFPKYRVAVDMRTGGLCLADVHEWHGNAKLESQPGQGRRTSLVFYYREKMQACGSATEERKRADAWQTDFQTDRAGFDGLLDDAMERVQTEPDPPAPPEPTMTTAVDAVLRRFSPRPLAARVAAKAPLAAPVSVASPDLVEALARSDAARIEHVAAIVDEVATQEEAAFLVPAKPTALKGEQLLPGFAPLGEAQTIVAPEPETALSAHDGTIRREFPELWAKAQEWAERIYAELVIQRNKSPW